MIRAGGKYYNSIARAGVTLAIIASTILTANAQQPPIGFDVAQTSDQRIFSIPPQPLSSALVLFGQQARRQITADGGVVQGLLTPGVQGTLTIEEALSRLLAGTGLTFSFPSGATIALQKPGQVGGAGTVQLDPVQVQGFSVPQQAMIDNLPPPYAGGQVATGSQLGLLGNRSVMDTPFNQTSYTAEKVKDQQARTVRDALLDDPSVQITWPNMSGEPDAMKIRGFAMSAQDISYGGLYGIVPIWSIAAELPERIEVLKGPSAMLNGMPPAGSIGGAINLVPKRAPNEDLTQLTAGYNSIAQFGGHVDIGRRIGPDKQVGIRFNGVYRAGELAVQRSTDQMTLTALGLDFRGERVRLAVDLGYQYEYAGGLASFASISAGVPIPGAPIASNSFGQSWGSAERKDIFGVARAEADITEDITAYATVGAHDNRASVLSGGYPNIVSANGNITQTPYYYNAYYSYFTAEGGLRARFATGPIDHEIAITGTTFSRDQGLGQSNGTAFASNIYTPNLVTRPNLPGLAANKISTQTLNSFGFADTLSAVDKRIQLTVGGRFQQVKAQNFNYTTGWQTSNYDQSAFSPSVALIFKPWSNVSFYGNFIQGLQQGITVAAGFTNAGEVFPPYKSTQYEVGVKVDWGKFTTTVSAFQIAQPSPIVNLASNTMSVNGEQRNRGIEVNFFGEPTEGVRLLGGAMFLDAVLAKTANGTNDGLVAAGTPAVQFNIAGEWDTPFARGLTLSGRVTYTGTQYVDVSSPRRSIPDWARLDLGARYIFDNVRGPTGKPFAVRFNVENVLDTNYWASVSSNIYLIQGAPRTFRLSLTADF